MKVTIVVGGRFHAFDLAQQLEKRGYLLNIITSYPAWKVNKNFHLEKKIISIFLKELVERLILKLRLENYFGFIFFYLNKCFEYFASKRVDYKNTNIIVGWAGFSYTTFKKAKNYNIIKILERGSSHIQFQSEILSEEYKKFNLEYKVDYKSIKNELDEYLLADYISVPSQFAKQTFLDKGFKEEKIILTPYGVNQNEFFPKEKKDTVFRFITVGTSSIRKGTLYTLQAFDELNLPNAELIIVGPISSEILPLIKKYKKNKRIKFFGNVTQNKLVDFYNISDVFVISSIEDGFAMVIVQALTCGLPVICTKNSGGSELIVNDYNGYVIPIREVSILKNYMNQLYRDSQNLLSLKKNLIRNKNLSWNNYGDKIETIYKSLSKTN
jgi:glycosyltransferase involved in cell wall biosynthesis